MGPKQAQTFQIRVDQEIIAMKGYSTASRTDISPSDRV